MCLASWLEWGMHLSSGKIVGNSIAANFLRISCYRISQKSFHRRTQRNSVGFPIAHLRHTLSVFDMAEFEDYTTTSKVYDNCKRSSEATEIGRGRSACSHSICSMPAGRRAVGLEPILGAMPIGVGKQPKDIHLVDIGKCGEYYWTCKGGRYETCTTGRTYSNRVFTLKPVSNWLG